MARKRRIARPPTTEEKLLKAIFAPIPLPQCNSCGDAINVSSNYCRACGAKNPHFDPGVFQYEQECSLIDEVARHCSVGHPEAKEDMKENFEKGSDWFEDYVDFPFCFVCGKNILKEFLKERRLQ